MGEKKIKKEKKIPQTDSVSGTCQSGIAKANITEVTRYSFLFMGELKHKNNDLFLDSSYGWFSLLEQVLAGVEMLYFTVLLLSLVMEKL